MALVQQLQGRVDIPTDAGPLLLQLAPQQRAIARTLAAAQVPPTAAEPPTLTPPAEGQAIDVELIELVGLLFQQMLDDEQLPDSVKRLLSYLHTPYLKVALLDRGFLDQPRHPARELLNTLIAAGEQWAEPERGDLLNQLQLVVQRILDEFDDDLRLFDQLHFELSQYLQQYTRRIRLAEQRARQAAQGEDRLREARGQVETYLQRRLEGIELPAPARTLLFEPWASYLAFSLLRFGPGSVAWQRAGGVVDQLLDHLTRQAATDDLARARDDQRWEQLEEALRQGFHTVGYDPDRGQRLIDTMRQAGGTLTAPPTQAHAAHAETGAADPLPEELARLEPGSWLLFAADRPRAEQYALKLAWSNPRTRHYMFVNRLGQQASLLRGHELAAALRAGALRILPGPHRRPFIERALERIAEQLRRRRPETTT
jgi:hypothetical protein